VNIPVVVGSEFLINILVAGGKFSCLAVAISGVFVIAYLRLSMGNSCC
jgi:hypothetical protein